MQYMSMTMTRSTASFLLLVTLCATKCFAIVAWMLPSSPGTSHNSARCHGTKTYNRRNRIGTIFTMSPLVCYQKYDLTLLQQSKQPDNNQKNDKTNDSDKNGADIVDEFLDRQFFDPDKVIEDNNDDDTTSSSPAFIRWFANLVKNDYETAEALYAGTFFVFLVILTQEALRWQLYGDNYVPFASGRSVGSLF